MDDLIKEYRWQIVAVLGVLSIFFLFVAAMSFRDEQKQRSAPEWKISCMFNGELIVHDNLGTRDFAHGTSGTYIWNKATYAPGVPCVIVKKENTGG